MTTGGFSIAELLEEEQLLTVPSLNNSDSVEIGEIAITLGNQKRARITVLVQIGEWIVFHVSLQGSKPENDWWINRKVAVVMLKQHSTMYEHESA